MTELVEIARFHSLPEAAVARSCLEAHGHVVVAMEYNHASVTWHHLFALGGVGLAAPKPEAEQARLLLATLAQAGGRKSAADAAEVERASPGVLKQCLSVVLLFALSVIVPPHVLKRRPAL
jgi:hypothetical protein